MSRAKNIYPSAKDRVEVFIAAREFAAAGGGGSWQPVATANFLDYLFRLPKDMLVGGEVGFRVVWGVNTGSTADKVTWRVLYSKITNDTTAGTGAPATVLGTIIAEDTAIATANAVQTTARGLIKSGVLIGMTAGTGFLKLRLNPNAVTSLTLGTDIVDFYGLIVDYVPRRI